MSAGMHEPTLRRLPEELTNAEPASDEFCLFGMRSVWLAVFRLLAEGMFVGLGVVGCVWDPSWKRLLEYL